MKIMILIAYLFLGMAALATPLAIAIGLYDWAVADIEFKVALWSGFKSWAAMFFGGLIVGLTAYYSALPSK